MKCRVMLILALACAMGCAGSDSNQAYIDDRAGLLSQAERQHVKEYHKALFRDMDVHFFLVILEDPSEDINRTAAQLFDELALGKTTKGAKGLLLLVDPIKQQVRVEVGYDLESIYTDAFVGYIERAQMAPFFAAGRIGAGVEAAVELLVAQAHGKADLAALKGGTVELAHGSGGGGAKADMPIGERPRNLAAASDADKFLPGQTPLASLRVYLDVLTQGVKNPGLLLYTPETRTFLSDWLVTDAQQENERKGLLQHLHDAESLISGERAVIRFPVEARTQSPYFFSRGPGAAWQLDLAAMSENIRFNHKNQWRFASTDHEYMFAFDRGRLGPNGFLRECGRR